MSFAKHNLLHGKKWSVRIHTHHSDCVFARFPNDSHVQDPCPLNTLEGGDRYYVFFLKGSQASINAALTPQKNKYVVYATAEA
jgi:hypothetical protein